MLGLEFELIINVEFGRASMLRNHELSIDQPERGLSWGWRARHKLLSVDPPEVAKLLHTRDVQLQLHCKQTPENKTKPYLKNSNRTGPSMTSQGKKL